MMEYGVGALHADMLVEVVLVVDVASFGVEVRKDDEEVVVECGCW